MTKVGDLVREAELELEQDLQARIKRWCDVHGLFAEVEVRTLAALPEGKMAYVEVKVSSYTDDDGVDEEEG